jgi:DNA polymerase III delta prime subunit
MKNEFHSILIINNQQSQTDNWLKDKFGQINQQLSPNNPDLFIIQDDYSINKIREIKTFLSKKPFQHQSKIVVIYSAQNLKTESQNALLKTIEEIGDNYIFLICNNKNTLLDTILSRCTLVNLKQTQQNSGKIISTNGQLSSKTYQKDEVQPLLEEQLYLYQQLLIKNPSLEISQKIKIIIKTLDMIKHNVDPLLALDYFFLTPNS